MVHQIQWHSYPHILYISVSGKLSVSDVETINQEILETAKQGEKPVYLIQEIVGDIEFPMDALLLSKQSALNDDIFTFTVIINAPQVITFVGRLVSALIRIKIAFADSIEKALTLIEEFESTK